MPRIHPPHDPVILYLDGKAVEAERGEPTAVALIAAGHLALARSPKFHRPRGPACLRGGCDGCLARVDDVPNVMTCRVPSRDGLRVETQNVLGSKNTDLLRVADWFFPEGMNHHELFAGVPGVERVMQGLARRVAGMGRLPGAVRAPRPAGRREVDVLVVGSGPSGMAAAIELAGRGREVEVVDDDLVWGGGARFLSGIGAGGWGPLLAAFDDVGDEPTPPPAGRRERRPARVSLRTTAAGLFGDDVLLASDGSNESDRGDGTAARVEVIQPRTLILAPGAHDGSVAFEGNDVPGVMSARAACRLLSHGVLPGAKVVVARINGGGPFGAAYTAARADITTVIDGVPVRVAGSARVKGVTVATVRGERQIPCDALLIDAPAAPAYELCAQAGAELVHEPRGFLVRTGSGGRIRDGIFAVGEAVGTPLEPGAVAQEARDLARYV